jgi:hypothetical protein
MKRHERCPGCLVEEGLANYTVGTTVGHTCGTAFPYAIVPAPGWYGDGRIRAISRHRTLAAARRAWHGKARYVNMPEGRRQYTRIVYWGRLRNHFWADMPPRPVLI